VELETATSTQPNLFDLWSAPLLIEPTRPADLREVDGVRFRAEHPIAAGFGGAQSSWFRAPSGIGRVTAIRLIGTLSYAFDTPQGQNVADLVVATDAGAFVQKLRAGVELAERAYDRPSLRGLVQHQRSTVALDFEEATPEGEAYTGHLYVADIALPQASEVRRLVIAPTAVNVLVEIHGVALVDANGAAHSLDVAARDGLRRVSDQVLLNSAALPRAYVLPRAQAFSLARHPGLTATQLVAGPDVGLHSMLLVEGDPTTPEEPGAPLQTAAAASADDAGPNVVRVKASASAPSYLVLNDFYQRGWTARVDGQQTRVFIANALFRAVAIEPGAHDIEFRFEPFSQLIGTGISAISLLVILAVIGIGYAQSRK
jgi:hypothetical protein